jgi:hypothetical protein
MIGLLESGLNIASTSLLYERNVRIELIIEEWRARFKGCFRVSHCWQGFVFNVDQVTSILSGVEVFS